MFRSLPSVPKLLIDCACRGAGERPLMRVKSFHVVDLGPRLAIDERPVCFHENTGCYSFPRNRVVGRVRFESILTLATENANRKFVRARVECPCSADHANESMLLQFSLHGSGLIFHSRHACKICRNCSLQNVADFALDIGGPKRPTNLTDRAF